MDARLRRLEKLVARWKIQQQIRRPSVVEVWLPDADGVRRMVGVLGGTRRPNEKPSCVPRPPEDTPEDEEDDEDDDESPAAADDSPASTSPPPQKAVEAKAATPTASLATKMSDQSCPTDDDPAYWFRQE